MIFLLLSRESMMKYVLTILIRTTIVVFFDIGK